MGLNKQIRKEKVLYNRILVSLKDRSIVIDSPHLRLQSNLRELMIMVGIDFEVTYKEQSMVKMGKLFAAVSNMLNR